ncbi:MAG: hypothetical protein ABIG95_04110 [Candidatus Woesearchaeota archaeon]
MESHAFGNFMPKNAKYLILGSFTAKQAVGKYYDAEYDWFYSNKRNQFWPILEAVYGVELKDRECKQQFCSKMGFAVADIILKCERTKNSNLDVNLKNIVYNMAIKDFLWQIEKIFFTSRFVEKKFRQVFKGIKPDIELVTLPSPSPRFTMRIEEKIRRYRELLPSR